MGEAGVWGTLSVMPIEHKPVLATELVELLAPHSPFGKDARSLRRRFHGGSFDDKLDSAGRIRVPKPLIEHADLSGPCVVIGAGEYLEIWNAEAWAKQEEELDATAPEIAEGLASGGTE